MKQNQTNKPDSSTGTIEKKILSRSTGDKQNWLSDKIAEEVAIAFSYNGQSHVVMMASPIQLNDFTIGFSYTEKIIDSSDDILGIDVQAAKRGICINIQIKPHLIERLETRQRKLSGRSGCGICGITDLAAAMPKLVPLKKTKLPTHQTINKAVEVLRNNQSLQDQCGAVHCAALFDNTGNLIAIREDIGRHNALDKLIGTSIDNHKLDYFILMSSRASHELIAKTVIAGIGTLVCISAATSLAIEMAEECNLNLIGFIRGDRQIVYTEDSLKSKT